MLATRGELGRLVLQGDRSLLTFLDQGVVQLGTMSQLLLPQLLLLHLDVGPLLLILLILQRLQITFLDVVALNLRVVRNVLIQCLL